jgi:predicted DNA-binding ribbon-helix-helix protein
MKLAKSAIIKRSIVVGKHKTSISLEDQFWGALKEIAEARKTTLSSLVNSIDSDRKHSNLSSAIRLFVLSFYRDQIPDPKPGMRLVAQPGGSSRLRSSRSSSS